MPKRVFKPRASSSGYYWNCLGRAALDILVDAGEIERPDEGEETPGASKYADLGTCEHFVLQDGIRAKFPGHVDDFSPTPDQWAYASHLFDMDMRKTYEMARKAATMAAEQLPELPKGVQWLAEEEFECDFATGHIDLLASDYLMIVDLKTTARRPKGDKAKLAHVIQLLTYWWLVYLKHGVKPEKGMILYVSSTTGEWALPVWIEYTSEPVQQLLLMVRDMLTQIADDPLAFADTAHPSPGAHCSDDFCPYNCRERWFDFPGRCVGTDFKSPLPSAGAMTSLLGDM